MEERQYDLIFICRPDTPEADVDKVITTLEHTAAEKGGKIEKTEKWGRKRMAYRVAKLREGFFVYMVVRSSHGEVVKELERRLKVSEPVIKFISVRMDEEEKRVAKIKAIRATRKKLSAQPAAAAPAPVEPAAAPAAATEAASA